MRVLITGGGGFMGAWITRQLARAGHELRVFDVHENRQVLAECAGTELAGQIE